MIEIRHLTKRFGAFTAVDDISLSVSPGEIYGFLGPNGAGKTTTIRILFDLIRPDEGSAAIFGVDCQRDSLGARALAGYLPGEIGFYPDMTGEETLDLTARLGGVKIDVSHRLQLADRLELAQSDLRRHIREYSTGMKRKLGLIQALQADPPLLVLDEPTEGLDPLVQRALHDILFELRGRGRTVFMSSHVLSEVERVCDRIAVIRKGKIVLLSTVEQARRRSGRIVRLHVARPVERIGLPPGAAFVDAQPERWTIRVESGAGELIHSVAALPLRDVEIVEPSLEDVLQTFYREARP